MEARGSVSQKQSEALPAFCRAMSESLAELVRQLSPTITHEDVRELPLITLGAQFQGANNNTIGKQATAGVFLVISELVATHIEKRSESKIVIVNSAGRTGCIP